MIIVLIIWIICIFFNLFKINQAQVNMEQGIGIYVLGVMLAPIFTIISILYVVLFHTWDFLKENI